jgi:hypothetical protein
MQIEDFSINKKQERVKITNSSRKSASSYFIQMKIHQTNNVTKTIDYNK